MIEVDEFQRWRDSVMTEGVRRMHAELLPSLDDCGWRTGAGRQLGLEFENVNGSVGIQERVPLNNHVDLPKVSRCKSQNSFE
jgi:hypothetical protein